MLSYAKFTYRHPYAPMIAAAIVLIPLTIWLLCSFGVHPGVIQTLYRWSGDDLTGRWDSYVGATKDSYSSLLALLSETIPFPQQFQLTQMAAIIWERAGANLLELESLHLMWEIEQKMRATPGWTDHCFYVPLERLPPFIQTIALDFIDAMKEQLSGLETQTNCIAFKSIFTELKEYMNNTWGVADARPDDLTEAIVRDFLTGNETRQHHLALVYMGTDFDPDRLSTSRMRSMFPLALPLKGFRNKADRTQAQMGLLSKWVLEFISPAIETQKTKPLGIQAYSANPFALDLMVGAIVVQHLLFVAAALVFVGVLSFVVTRSVLIAGAGTLGLVFCIPCAIATQQGIVGIRYWDAANVISLFVIVGVGAGSQFVAFEIFRAFRSVGMAKRLAITAQRSLVIIGTCCLVSASMYLSLLSSGVRIMGFLGIFFALLLFYTLFFLLAWTIPVFALWAKWFEPVDGGSLRSPSFLSLQSRSRSDSRSHDCTSEDDDGDESDPAYKPVEYPYTELFGFAQKQPIFNVDGAGNDPSRYNFIQIAFYRYLTSVVYFYRLPIVITFLALAIGLGCRAFSFGTKGGFQFLDSYHPVQRGMTLFLEGFANPAVDQEFIYLWGIDRSPRVKFSERLTADSYGTPTYKPPNVTDPAFQTLINNLYGYLVRQPFIDSPDGTDQFGVNPWLEWSIVFGFGDSWIGWLLRQVIAQMGLPELPTSFPIRADQWSAWGWLFQLLAGELSYEEPDNFFDGMLKAGCMGFSRSDYHLQYIGVKAPWRMPSDHVLSHAVYRRFYDTAVAIDAQVRENATALGLDVDGWFTGASFLEMTTEERLPGQVVVGSVIGIGASAAVLLLCTLSVRYSAVVTLAIGVVHFIILGVFAVAGWRIGCNETVMFTVIGGLVAQFLIVPTISVVSDRSGRSMFGKLQFAVVTFSAPVLYTLCATIAGCSFMFPCDIVLLQPFATLQMTSAAFAALLGLFGVPAALAIVYGERGKNQADCQPLPQLDPVLAK